MLKVALLGKAFSGKKTLTERLTSEYNLKPFYVQKLVDEAVEIANPPPKEEVADPKAKGKAPAKGAVAEEPPQNEAE